MIGHALRLWQVSLESGDNRKRFWLIVAATLAFPSLAHAQAADLQTAVESDNAIIM